MSKITGIAFYASVSGDGCAIHLKEGHDAPVDRGDRRQEEHLDAYVAVSDAAALHRELQASGAFITTPLEDMPWSCRELYVEDPDGHILRFSELMA